MNATDSIQMTLIPGQTEDLDKKLFGWKIDKFTESEMIFQLDFENPKSISNLAVAKMSIKFFN